jgi:aryl-alcohol dehydrogenase-like predicted oxidoreductase
MLKTGNPTRREFLAAGAAGWLAGRALGAPGDFQASARREFERGGMVYRRLGQTDMNVSLLSFGSHTDPADRVPAGQGKTILTPAGQARRDRIIAHAFDLGVNLLDVYASESQWEPAARLVRGRRDKILVSLAHEVTPGDIELAMKLFGYVDLYRFAAYAIDQPVLEKWDLLRKAKEAGKIRAIGVSVHTESLMTMALEELEDLDYVILPYNFIQARAGYSQFLPQALHRGVGLIAMKPLAMGSIMKLDPRARAGAKPESENFEFLGQRAGKLLLPAAVAELTASLSRLPDETLCMAAMRFVYSRPFLSAALTGMFEDRLLEDNYKALSRYWERRPEEQAALGAAKRLAELRGASWLRPEYRWLEEEWHG